MTLASSAGGLEDRTQGKSLATATSHGLARVTEVIAEHDDAVRLKSLGICAGRKVQVVKSGDPLIVRVLGARVGLSVRLAAGVLIEEL